jgi:hypothetical protein
MGDCGAIYTGSGECEAKPLANRMRNRDVQAPYLSPGSLTSGDWRDAYAEVGAGSRGWKGLIGVGY